MNGEYDENRITYFAETDSRSRRISFGIKAKDRTKHIYVIGKTGMGKSTLLENMAAQDIKSGEGFAFIDPHGSTAEVLLGYIPEERIKDVLYFAPFDLEYPIAFNVMEDVGYDKRHLVASGLMSAFKKIWVDAWSARMEYILNNTILALLEFPGSTMLSINRMFSDKVYRKRVVDNITDSSVRSFWVDEFAKYTDKFAAEATPAIQNKVGQFTSNPVIRNIIGQPRSTFDIRKMMDDKKILIINLSKGRIGEANANLLGSMLITKIYLAAMSRADLTPTQMSKLANFYLYVDEFQSFANESFADILSEARKYKLNLTIAHQYIEQMTKEVRAAVFGNVGTTITFRVGPFDAEILEKMFAPKFEAQDIVNLGKTQIYLSLMIDGVGSAPFSATTLPPLPPPEISHREEVIEHSRHTYALPRSEVTEDIQRWHETGDSVKPPESLSSQNVIEVVPATPTPHEPLRELPLSALKTPMPLAKKKEPSQKNTQTLRDALESLKKSPVDSPSTTDNLSSSASLSRDSQESAVSSPSGRSEPLSDYAPSRVLGDSVSPDMPESSATSEVSSGEDDLRGLRSVLASILDDEPKNVRSRSETSPSKEPPLQPVKERATSPAPVSRSTVQPIAPTMTPKVSNIDKPPIPKAPSQQRMQPQARPQSTPQRPSIPSKRDTPPASRPQQRSQAPLPLPRRESQSQSEPHRPAQTGQLSPVFKQSQEQHKPQPRSEPPPPDALTPTSTGRIEIPADVLRKLLEVDESKG